MKRILHLLGFHNLLNSKKMVFGVDDFWEIDYKIYIDNPWSQFTTIESRYKCLDCGRLFWMPSGNFEEEKMREYTYQLVMKTSRELWEKGEYDKAIEILKNNSDT